MNPLSILIVDDDKIILTLIDKLLSRGGHHAVAISSGAQAEELLEDAVFDLVITDLYLGEISGFDVVRQVQRLQPWARIFMMTGSRESSAADEAKRLGVDEYLLKPFSMTLLIDHLSRLKSTCTSA